MSWSSVKLLLIDLFQLCALRPSSPFQTKEHKEHLITFDSTPTWFYIIYHMYTHRFSWYMLMNLDLSQHFITVPHVFSHFGFKKHMWLAPGWPGRAGAPPGRRAPQPRRSTDRSRPSPPGGSRAPRRCHLATKKGRELNRGSPGVVNFTYIFIIYNEVYLL